MRSQVPARATFLVQCAAVAAAANHQFTVDVNINISWQNVTRNTSTAATIEVDVMPFLARTTYGGPFDAYFEALSHLGSEFVRFSPWFPNPRAVVAELTPSDCTSTQPATNWNSTIFDEIVRDFMSGVCGANAVSGACTKSVVQQLSTMPSWLYRHGLNESKLPSYAWNTTDPFSSYNVGKSLVDPSCGQLARYFGRVVGHYTNGGHHDECGHWHASGFNYSWWGISVLNEDEHHIAPDHGPAYVKCFDAIVAEVAKVNPATVLVGPEEVADNEMMLYFLNGSNHANGEAPQIASYHAGARATNSSATTFFDQWDQQLGDTVKVFEDFKRSTGQATEFVVNEFIPFVQDWCDCKGIEHACGGERYPTGNVQCPSWQEPSTAGGDPNIQHAKGIGMNKRTWSWNAAAAVFAYGYATLAELRYKYVGQDQLIGGTWPDNEPSVSSIDWQTGMPNAKYWVTHLLATTVGDAQTKSLVETTLSPGKAQPKETSCSISLVKQLSDHGQCIKDKSFGCYVGNHSMWIADGCRGDFMCDGTKVKCDVGSSTMSMCTCDAKIPVHAMAYVKDGQHGMLLINKEDRRTTVRITGDRIVRGGDAMVVEVDTVGDFRDEPATAPPVARQLNPSGILELGPFAVAVVTRFEFYKQP